MTEQASGEKIHEPEPSSAEVGLTVAAHHGFRNLAHDRACYIPGDTASFAVESAVKVAIENVSGSPVFTKGHSHR